MAQLLRLPVPGAGGPQLPVVCIAVTLRKMRPEREHISHNDRRHHQESDSEPENE